MSIKKAFTLVEILIVIVIIGIIMGMTMNFWWNQIRRLQTKTIEETYLDTLNILQNKVLMSNYYEDKKFSKLTLTFEKGNSVKSKFIGEGIDNNINQLQLMDSSHVIDNIWSKKDNDEYKSINSILVKYIPYEFWCEIVWWEDSNKVNYNNFVFQTTHKNKKTCYQLTATTCKYQRKDCWDIDVFSN